MDAVVVIVIVELPPAVTLEGLKLAPAPLGNPLALSETVCAEPLVTAVLIVDVALPPGVTLTLLGEALMEKSFGGGGEPQVPALFQLMQLAFDWKGPMKPAVATRLSAPGLAPVYVHEMVPLIPV